MMKKIWIITGCFAMVAVLVSCHKVRRSPGRAYMPDMTYSRAYETYSSTDNLKKEDINYNAMPVPGAIARGDEYPYRLPNNDSGYTASANTKSPLDESKINMTEAERLYLVNCAICHGPKLDGNGPLWKGGDGPYPVAPKNFMAEDMKALPEGTMFHVATYGKGQMGSYASQLSTDQRWEVVAYIKMKQGAAAATAADTTKTK
ncbi:MAG: cytochrome c [Chitinophagaceae bacterium]